MRSQKTINERISFAWEAKAEKTKIFEIEATKGKTLTVDWGDGSVIETITVTKKLQKIKHKYSKESNYCVTITALATDCCFTALFCSKKELTSLNLDNCTSLEDLQCYGNQLTNIDLCNNKNLKEIDLGSNKLHSLDLSNNLELWDLDCAFNQLSSLDVENNTKLLNLKCHFNQLNNLNISSNTKLQLQHFDCRYNLLSDFGQNNSTE